MDDLKSYTKLLKDHENIRNAMSKFCNENQLKIETGHHNHELSEKMLNAVSKDIAAVIEQHVNDYILDGKNTDRNQLTNEIAEKLRYPVRFVDDKGDKLGMHNSGPSISMPKLESFNKLLNNLADTIVTEVHDKAVKQADKINKIPDLDVAIESVKSQNGIDNPLAK